ncbi:UNVERIFIED_ORG: hypothetical protein J2S29_002380 [Rhizobium sp. SLBN-170]
MAMIYEIHANTAENNRPLALIVGANGGVGSHVSKMLLQRLAGAGDDSPIGTS